MGGTPNEGIMNGIVDRKGYAQGPSWEEVMAKNPNIAEAYGAFGAIDAPRDTSLSEMLIGGGLNLVSGAGAGEGLMSNIAKSYKGPSEEFFKRQQAASDYDRKLKQAAVQSGLEQKWTMAQIKAKDNPQSALFNVYLQQGVEQGMSGAEAQRFATYHTEIQDKLRRKVGDNLMGGIIEDNFNTLNKDQRRKKLSKLKKTGMGKYFYDPYDGKIKQLVERDGQVVWRAFGSVDSIDLTPDTGTSTVRSTPYADTQEFREIEKQEGNILDEDIAAIRGY